MDAQPAEPVAPAQPAEPVAPAQPAAPLAPPAPARNFDFSDYLERTRDAAHYLHRAAAEADQLRAQLQVARAENQRLTTDLENLTATYATTREAHDAYRAELRRFETRVGCITRQDCNALPSCRLMCGCHSCWEHCGHMRRGDRCPACLTRCYGYFNLEEPSATGNILHDIRMFAW